MSKPKKIKFTVETAVLLARTIEAALSPIGYHVGLTGSVLFKGDSTKDADFIIYPHDPNSPQSLTPKQIFAALEKVGFSDPYETDEDYVNRTVWLCKHEGRRVDLFFF